MIYVLYHASCLDGFGAAYAAWKKFGDKAEYIAVRYHEPPPAQIEDGDEIFVLDFSYSRETLLTLAKTGPVVVIDHHKSAQEDLLGLGFAYFNMSHSGAVLAWHYFHPDQPVPQLLLHVEDRDLWNFEMPSTKAICESLWMQSKDFVAWHHYANDRSALKRLKIEGDFLLLAKDSTVRQMCYGAFVCTIGDQKVIACNAPVHVSEVCHELLSRHPECAYAVGFRITREQGFRWDFRSKKGSGVDVSEVAKRYGGGGHENAAGTRTDFNILMES